MTDTPAPVDTDNFAALREIERKGEGCGPAVFGRMLDRLDYLEAKVAGLRVRCAKAEAEVSIRGAKIASLQLYAERLHKALERLASPEAFEVSKMASPEETARMKFAQEAVDLTPPSPSKIGEVVNRAREWIEALDDDRADEMGPEVYLRRALAALEGDTDD